MDANALAALPQAPGSTRRAGAPDIPTIAEGFTSRLCHRRLGRIQHFGARFTYPGKHNLARINARFKSTMHFPTADGVHSQPDTRPFAAT